MAFVVDQFSLIRKMKLLAVIDKFFVLDPATTFCAQIDRQAWEILSSYQRMDDGREPSTIVEKLKDQFPPGLANAVLDEWESVAETQKLGNPENTDYPLFPVDHRFHMLALNLVHGCNLRCSYCFAEHGTFGSGPCYMSKETARKAIVFFLENSPDELLSIAFFGGEPLLNKPVLFHASEYALQKAKESGKRIKFSLTTNGTLLDDEVADFLQVRDFSSVVSLDGPPQFHNECRTFASGKGSHEIILKNLERVRNTNVSRKTTLRATFTAGRIALLERVLYLDELVRLGYGTNYSVEPASLAPGAPLGFDSDSLKELAKQYESLALVYLTRARAGNPMRFFHFEVFVRRIVSNEKAANECGAGNGMMVVNPKEEIYACHHEGNSIIGTLDGGIDPSLREQWRLNNLGHRRPCPTCWARYLCGGGCRHDAIMFNNDPAEPDRTACAYKQAMIRVGIWLAAGMPKENWQAILGSKSRRQ